MRPGHALRHVFVQQGEHLVPLGAVQRDALLQVGVQRAAAHEFRRHVLVHDRRAEVQRLLADIDLVQQLHGSEDPAQPEARGENLGEAPQVERPLRRQGIDGRHRLAAVAQLPVRAVFYDQEILLPRHRHQLFALFQRHRLPARILEIRNHVAELRPRASGAKDLDFGAVGLEGLQGAEVGRGGGENHVAGIDEHAGADVDTLLRGGRDLHVLHRDAIAPRDHLPELRHALRRPVLERLGAIFLQHLRADAADVLNGEGRRVGIAAGERINRR